jgi:hypothetical protein
MGRSKRVNVKEGVRLWHSSEGTKGTMSLAGFLDEWVECLILWAWIEM